MSGNMPELGSKISLISKADIRYEGRLFTVDPNECTIALSNVRSFGTEDRETQCPIAAQNQVYDYILFRGSDIKDIRVCNSAPIPNDPAIMQMHLPPNQMGQQGFQPHFPMAALGHMGGPPQMGQFGAPYMGNMGGMSNQNLPPGNLLGMQKQQKPSELNVAIPEPAEHKDQASMLDLIGGGGGAGSRSTTPQSLVSRKSPTADMAVQVNQPRNDVKRGGHQQRNQRERRDSGKGGEIQDKGNRNYNNKQNYYQQRQPHQGQGHQGSGSAIGVGGGSGGGNMSNHQGNQNQQRGWVQRGQLRGGRGRGRAGPNQQPFRQPGPNAKPRGGKSIKFDSDYDFEQANNKFEELRSQLAKLKVGEEAKPEQQVNGESEKKEKDDSGNETGAGEHEPEEDPDIVVGYDKTKSFFDNISCEAATDRSKGKNRTDWRQERKLNSETFGVSSTRRGGYRGRGGFYNRGINMGTMGGYRGNFRGSNFRGNRNNNSRTGQTNSTSTGLPQKNPQTSSQQPQQIQQSPAVAPTAAAQ